MPDNYTMSSPYIYERPPAFLGVFITIIFGIIAILVFLYSGVLLPLLGIVLVPISIMWVLSFVGLAIVIGGFIVLMIRRVVWIAFVCIIFGGAIFLLFLAGIMML